MKAKVRLTRMVDHHREVYSRVRSVSWADRWVPLGTGTIVTRTLCRWSPCIPDYEKKINRQFHIRFIDFISFINRNKFSFLSFFLTSFFSVSGPARILTG